MSRDYGWKRFWSSREGTYSLADGGFLVDPEGKYGRQLNPNLMHFARFAGPDYTTPVFEPEAKKLLCWIEPVANHYDVRAVQ
jgi:hypothetical protein